MNKTQRWHFQEAKRHYLDHAPLSLYLCYKQFLREAKNPLCFKSDRAIKKDFQRKRITEAQYRYYCSK